MGFRVYVYGLGKRKTGVTDGDVYGDGIDDIVLLKVITVVIMFMTVQVMMMAVMVMVMMIVTMIVTTVMIVRWR